MKEKGYYTNKHYNTINQQNIEDKSQDRISDAPSMEIDIESLRNKLKTNEIR